MYIIYTLLRDNAWMYNNQTVRIIEIRVYIEHLNNDIFHSTLFKNSYINLLFIKGNKPIAKQHRANERNVKNFCCWKTFKIYTCALQEAKNR